MNEIVLNNRRNGMAVLLLSVAFELAAIAALIVGGVRESAALLAVGVIALCVGWIPLLGLRVLKPQEALVLTLFGKYIGTLKGEGFYFVNPFCTAVNPAARTRLNQSGDVDTVKVPHRGGQRGARGVREQKNLAQNHDPEQQPAKN